MPGHRFRHVGLALLGALGGATTPVSAHVGSLSESGATGSVPAWLTVLTGGGIVGISFLFTSLWTDHDDIRAVGSWRFPVRIPHRLRRAGSSVLRLASVAILGLILVFGLRGPTQPLQNLAILLVWAGWWVAYTISVYLVVDSWPVLNPWRTLARFFERPTRRAYPERLGSWPAVVGLLALIVVEVVSPVAQNPRALAVAIVFYSVVTLTGARRYGSRTWFARADPVGRVFRCYGRLAVGQRHRSGVSLTLPGSGLIQSSSASENTPTAAQDARFVVALVWVSTYDGLVSTPAWRTFLTPLVERGVPAVLLYLLAMLAGYALFLGSYRFATSKIREHSETYVSTDAIRSAFAPSLVPIAAGYHLAHVLGYLLGLWPSLIAVLQRPLNPPETVTVLVAPSWFPGLLLAFVVLGHLLAVWVAHAIANELFPGRIQPVRSQLPLVVLMVAYTSVSFWIVGQPSSPPPYL